MVRNKIDDTTIQKIVELKQEGYTLREIADAVGVSTFSVSTYSSHIKAKTKPKEEKPKPAPKPEPEKTEDAKEPPKVDLKKLKGQEQLDMMQQLRNEGKNTFTIADLMGLKRDFVEAHTVSPGVALERQRREALKPYIEPVEVKPEPTGPEAVGEVDPVDLVQKTNQAIENATEEPLKETSNWLSINRPSDMQQEAIASIQKLTKPVAKDIKGKPRLALVPPKLIEAVAEIRAYGTEKYGDPENWKKVDAVYYEDALYRHWLEYLKDRNSVDAESRMPHLWHAACNLAFLIEMSGLKS